MDSIEFIEKFTKNLEIYTDYNEILEDLNSNVFPFHNKDKHTNSRRYYYWLKQNNSFKFKNLNGELKKMVKIRKKANIVDDSLNSI
jgi:hypothetical protein